MSVAKIDLDVMRLSPRETAPAAFPPVAAPSLEFFRIGSGTATVNAAGTFAISVYHSGGGSEIYRADAPGGPFSTVAVSPTDRMHEVVTSLNAAGTVVYLEEGSIQSDGVYTVESDGTRTVVAMEGALFRLDLRPRRHQRCGRRGLRRDVAERWQRRPLCDDGKRGDANDHCRYYGAV